MSQIRHSLDGTIKAQILSREMAHAYLTGTTAGPTIYAIRCTLYAVLNMQNKPNFQGTQMNVNSYNTTDYENKWQRKVRKNKPNSNPIKPNCLKAKMDVTSILTKDYERNDIFAVYENKPNPNPIQTQTNPIKPCPEPIEFTLSVIEGNGPISKQLRGSFLRNLGLFYVCSLSA